MQRRMLTDDEIYKVIPQSFVICNNKVEIILRDDITIDDGEDRETRYGQWNEVLNTIELAKGVIIGDDKEATPVNLEQIQNTFAHEVCHCFEFYSGMPYDEQRVQLFANWFREYETSKKFKK